MKIELKEYHVHGYGFNGFAETLDDAKELAKEFAKLGEKKNKCSQFVFIDKLDYTPEGSYLLNQGYTPY